MPSKLDTLFSQLLSGKCDPDKLLSETIREVSKDRTSELLVESQKNEIQRLEHKVNTLISVLITMTNKSFQKNAEYWNEYANNSYNRVHEQPIQDQTVAK